MGRKVKIEIKGTDHVGPTLLKSKADEMVWTSDGGDFTIQFKGESPFGAMSFASKNGRAESGPIRPDADVGPYDYDVIGPSPVQAAADPTVFIDR
jgi:hypothetical protein